MNEYVISSTINDNGDVDVYIISPLYPKKILFTTVVTKDGINFENVKLKI